MSDLELSNVQGLILRSYGMSHARLFVLRIDSPPLAKQFLRALVSGENPAVPPITTGALWNVKPDCTLNLGITYAGLQALGLPDSSLQSFPQEFAAVSLDRLTALGDVGESAPENWIAGLAWSAGKPSAAHLFLLTLAQDKPSLETVSAALRQRFGADGAMTELAIIEGEALPGRRLHFGYIDGLSQPRIEGVPSEGGLDDQPLAPTGEFLLGYPNQYGNQYPVPAPPELGQNGTYAAFRLLKQDVAAFEAFLEAQSPAVPVQPGVDPKEKLAAKLCGRWRNGVPLALSPETDTPDPPLAFDQLNAFDYAPSADYPNTYDDHKGFRCPLGAHIRRANPRSGVVAGRGNHLHRVLRRGMPYGPVYDPANPHDGIERGLFGVFLCASLKDQFEFLMTQWINGDSFGLGGDLDPVAGNNDPARSQFKLPLTETPHQPLYLTGFERFVVTRGSAYCFLPSLTAIRFLAAL